MSDSATPWTIACTRLLCSWDFPGKITRVGCHFLSQGIFPNQGSNPGLPPCRQTLYPLSHWGSFITQHEEPKKWSKGDGTTNLEKSCPSIRRTCLLSISLTPPPCLYCLKSNHVLQEGKKLSCELSSCFSVL